MTKTERIRQALKGRGWCTTFRLSSLSGVNANRVSALLNYDIRAGRVIKSNTWPRQYRLATQAELDAKRIELAARLLTRHGYTVTPPSS